MKSPLVNMAYAQGVNHADAIAAVVTVCLPREAEWGGINNLTAMTAPVWCQASCHQEMTDSLEESSYWGIFNDE